MGDVKKGVVWVVNTIKAYKARSTMGALFLTSKARPTILRVRIMMIALVWAGGTGKLNCNNHKSETMS